VVTSLSRHGFYVNAYLVFGLAPLSPRFRRVLAPTTIQIARTDATPRTKAVSAINRPNIGMSSPCAIPSLEDPGIDSGDTDIDDACTDASVDDAAVRIDSNVGGDGLGVGVGVGGLGVGLGVGGLGVSGIGVSGLGVSAVDVGVGGLGVGVGGVGVSGVGVSGVGVAVAGTDVGVGGIGVAVTTACVCAPSTTSSTQNAYPIEAEFTMRKMTRGTTSPSSTSRNCPKAYA
jgi:hypothetical protein